MKSLAAVLAGVLAFATAMTQSKEPPKPEVGKAAPMFRVNDHSGAAVKVGGESDDWTVLAFYPKASTPG